MSLRSIRVSTGIFLDVILFPLTYSELFNSLEKIGFDINPAIPIPRPIGRFRGSGQVAKKGKITLNIDGGDKSLIMYGDSLEEAINEFTSFSKTLSSDYLMDLDENSKFYQVTAAYEYKSDFDPSEAISKAWKNPDTEKISDIFEISVTTYAVRFASADNLPNEKNWFEINITPDILRNDGFSVEILYRNEDKDRYTYFINHIEDRILKTINLLKV